MGAKVVAQHRAKDEILLRCQLVQRTGDDESDSLQALAASEVHVEVFLTGRLKHVRDALTLQSLYGLITISFIAGEQHHLAHALLQFVDVVHQYFNFRRNSCRSHRHIACYFLGAKLRRNMKVRNT